MPSGKPAPTIPDDSSSNRSKWPSPWRLLAKFLFGMSYLLFVSAILAASLAGEGKQLKAIVPVFIVLTCGTLLLLFVLLTWLAGSIAHEGRPRQFRLISLFYLTGLTAAYLALVRWLVEMTSPGRQPLDVFVAVSIVCAVFAVLGLIPLLCWSESVVWFAAWFVRRKWVQRWVFGRHPKKP